MSNALYAFLAVVQHVHQGSDISYKHQNYLHVLYSTCLDLFAHISWVSRSGCHELQPGLVSVPLGAGNELEELLHMWHLAFQPSFSGACGFFPMHILILLHEGKADSVENGHSGSCLLLSGDVI